MFRVAWRAPVAVCDDVILRVLFLVPAQPVENIPERVNHRPRSALRMASLGVGVVDIGLEIGCCQVSLKPPLAQGLLGFENVG